MLVIIEYTCYCPMFKFDFLWDNKSLKEFDDTYVNL